jgi:hypothetical protein
VGVLGAKDPLADWQQRGELVAVRRRIPRCPGPAGELGAGVEGIGVLSAEHPLPGVGNLLLKNARRRIVAAAPQEAGRPYHGVAVRWVYHLHVGQQRSRNRPGSRPLYVSRQSGTGQ